MLGFKKRPKTEWVVIHCSKTRADATDRDGNPYGYKALKEKHPTFEIGYHWLIDRSGAAIQCRPEDVPGNHCPGFNQVSVAICLMGGLGVDGPESNFTNDQWRSLELLVSSLLSKYPGAKIASHSDLAGREGEWCPSFDARHWWANLQYRERTNAKKAESKTGSTSSPPLR